MNQSISNHNSTSKINVCRYHVLFARMTKCKLVPAGIAGHFKIFIMSSLVYHPLVMRFAFVSLLVMVLVLY